MCRPPRRYLHPDIEVVTAALNDAWMRDIGPTFVLDDGGRLGAVDWVFNGWGGQDWAAWDKDALVAAAVAARSGASHLVSPLVNEGGGIHVDGEGTVLVTETVQLDPGRNPGLSKADVEAELARTLGRQPRRLASPRPDPGLGTVRHARPRRHRRGHPVPGHRAGPFPAEPGTPRLRGHAGTSSATSPPPGTRPAANGTSSRSPPRKP